MKAHLCAVRPAQRSTLTSRAETEVRGGQVMTVSTTCRRCEEPIVAVDEDDLVGQV
jgi:hypothetical protein